MSDSFIRLSQETSPRILFPRAPIVRFLPETEKCCGRRLDVQKTRKKKVHSMTGPIFIHETVRQCRSCSKVFFSEELERLVQRRCNVAYDVLVFVGKALFQRHKTISEVRSELAARNTLISKAEIGYLGRKFILYLAAAHRRAAPRICQVMKQAGGYILHLDAMHDSDAPALMTGIDSLSKIVLANVKIPSEHADHIIPFLKEIKVRYGTPRACVHDMGTGICKAVTKVFPDTLDFICHFHFLRDIGKDFIEPAYRELRKYMHKCKINSTLSALIRDTRQRLNEKSSNSAMPAKVLKGSDFTEDPEILPLASTYSLAMWVLRGKSSGDGYGFPFDRPLLNFAERLLELDDRIPELMDSFQIACKENKSVFKLTEQITKACKDPGFHQVVDELYWRCQIFDLLRNVMRIALPGGRKGLNDEGEDISMSTIRQGVQQFRQEIENDVEIKNDHLIQKMMVQIEKYGEKLFSDPIEVPTSNGTTTIYPQRTNNILEQFFRCLRRGYRRKTGNNSMSQALQAMIADTPLVKNLDNPDYMKILLEGKSGFEELFAELDQTSDDIVVDLQFGADRILPGFQSLIDDPNMPDQILNAFDRMP